MKKKKISKFLAVAATTTMAVTPLGAAGNVLASPTTESEVASTTQSPQQAMVSKFNLYGKTDTLNAYNQQFKVKNPTVTSNSGSYPGTSLNNLFDGTRSTHWETNKSNSETYKNELTFTFETVTELNRIIYSPRTTGAPGKGFPLAFEIHGNTEDGGEFEVIATGSYSGSRNDDIEIEIEPTQFKQLKFVFTNASEGWAAASEFMFYKQDEVAEQVDRLFTDSKKNTVSEEFNTVEKLAAVEEQLGGHPLEAVLMESVEDAKAVLAMEEVTPTTAETQAFKYYDNADYKKQFMVPLTNIEGYSNNGGHYASSALKYAFDGDASTYWETRTSNSADFKNTVEVEFKEAVDIDRLVYGARPSDRKGFITGFDIYISPTSEGDTYQLVSSGGYTKVSGLVEAKFDTTKAKRVKLVATNSDQNWATLSELAFFTEDTLANKVDNLFTDGTMSELTSAFNTVDKIIALENEVKKHPLYDITFKEQLALAKKVANGEVALEGRVITVEQNGDMVSHAKNNLKFTFGNNNQPIGIAAQPGDIVTIFVEADASKPLPQIVFGQQEGSFANWQRSVQLHSGKNVIEVPTVPKDSWYHHDVVKGGTMYIHNPYTPEQQGSAPIIRVEGGERVPFLTEDTDPVEFKKFLIDYKARLDADIEAHPNVADRKLIDVIEVVSDHLVFTGTATGAYQAYVTDGYDPAKTVATYNQYMDEIFAFYGLDGNNEKDDPKAIRENIRLMQPFGYMYAYTNHTGVQGDVMVSMLKDGVYSWGVAHEIGHRMDVNARLYGESTNNMIAMKMGVLNGQIDGRIPYAEIYNNAFTENGGGDFRSKGYFARLGAFWQLEMYYPGYWAELNSLYRERNINAPDEATMQKYLVELSSEVVGEDLSEFFARHGFVVTDEVKQNVSKYPKAKKVWYLNNNIINYKGEGFTANASVDVKIVSNESAQTHTLSLAINNEDKDNLLGYEIRRDGEAIGFTAGSSFTVKNVDTTQATEYQIVAYDKKLGVAEAVDINSFKPTIHTAENVKIALRDPNFNALAYVKALDSTGKDITNSVKVKSNNVDLTKKGDYEIVYEVTSQGVTTTATMPVTVTSEVDYLSDLQEVSAKIAWNGLRKDLAPEGTQITLLRNGIPTTYAKGLGAHANSEVVYNVEGKDYDYFESRIGIDQAMAGKNSSATFKVLIDGEEVYASGVFGSGTDSQYIKVPIKEGAKTVTLITTDAGTNHNTSDHTVWADAKFTKDSSKPVISVTSAATKVGEPIDIIGQYSSTDAEDGDLTNQVKVTGTEAVDFNQAGDYTLTYTVTDNDGNEVTATRTISVVDMQDFSYLSAYNWKSESHSYTAPKKDLATSGNKLRLTGNDGKEVVYDKGIGAHSNSTIVYDLTDKEAAYFTSYVGVDRQMYNSVGSVVFQVFVDGEKKFDSGLMTAKMAQQYVEVNLAGAKELKLVVTDGGNGNGSDHATWGDAKLHYANEDRPKAIETNEVVQFKNLVVEAETVNIDKEILAVEENINRIVQVVKNALNDATVNISDIKAIVAGNPTNTTFSGTKAELSVKASIEEQFADIPGTFKIVLHNRETSESVEDLVQSGLTITYQLEDSESTYTYKKGRIMEN